MCNRMLYATIYNQSNIFHYTYLYSAEYGRIISENLLFAALDFSNYVK